MSQQQGIGILKKRNSIKTSKKVGNSFSPGFQKKGVMPINEQNISIITNKQQVSFLSNKMDRSLDSFDKMIIGIDQQLGLQDNSHEYRTKQMRVIQQLQHLEEQGKVKDKKQIQFSIQNINIIDYNNKSMSDDQEEPNYSYLYKQYRRLVVDQEEQWLELSQQIQEYTKEEWSNKQATNMLRQRLQQIKELRVNSRAEQSGSMRLLGANLSEINQQQIQHNSSMNRMDPIQQQFIDFVGNGQGSSKINISKIQGDNRDTKQGKLQIGKMSNLKQIQQDQVVAMLENQLLSRVDQEGSVRNEGSRNQQSSRFDNSRTDQQRLKKQSFQKQNYNQILRQLQDNEQKKLDSSHLVFVSQQLQKRMEWLQNQKSKSKIWRKKQIKLISKIKQIMQNPYLQFSQDEDFELEL